MTPERRLARRAYDAARRNSPARRWYKLKAWAERRRRQLQDQPSCEECLRLSPPKVTRATIADHVEPHRGDYERFWFGKLQSLCAPCHDRIKQAEERRGFSAEIGEDGWPADPKHPFNRSEARRV
jgi:hypothetical protein